MSIEIILAFIAVAGIAIISPGPGTLRAVRSRRILVQPSLAKWVNRIVGTVFISFGAALLVLRRPLA